MLIKNNAAKKGYLLDCPGPDAKYVPLSEAENRELGSSLLAFVGSEGSLVEGPGEEGAL